MRLLAILAGVFVFISQASCTKEVVVKPPFPPPDTSKYPTKLDIKWIEWFDKDTVGAYYLDPVFYENYVFFCTRSMLDKGNLSIAAFHKQTGFRNPVWDDQSKDLIQGYGKDIPDWKLCSENNKIAILGSKNKLYSWDLVTGNLVSVCNHAPLFGIADLSCIFGVPYHTCYYGNKSFTTLRRINPLNGVAEDLITITASDKEMIWMQPPSGWISPSNDTVVVFMTQGYRNSTQGFVNAYAYDLTNKKFLWDIELTPPYGSTSMNAPLVIRNRVVFITASGLHCVDIPTGTIKWEHKFQNPLKGFNYKPLYVDGRIYQRSTEDVMAIDAHTGTILWEYKDKINNLEGGSMAYYKGNLYFTAEDGYDPYYARYLFCLEGATGKLIWKDKGPHEYSGMAFGVIVDPATGYLYATDAFRMMCIDLNNTPKKP